MSSKIVRGVGALILVVTATGATTAQDASTPSGWGWSQDRTLETYRRMGPFVPDGDRLLMLGERADPYRGVSGGGDLLVTHDGMAWELVSIMIPTPWTLAGFERTDVGLVAVGSTPSDAGDQAAKQPVAWLSRDTESWRPSAWQNLVLEDDGFSVGPVDPDPGLGRPQVAGEMTGLAAGPDGLVAVGRYWCEPPCSLGPDGATDRPAIWRSATGESWDRVPWGAGVPRADAIGMVRGRFVIGGADGLWSSSDATAWSRLDLDTDGSTIIGIAEGPDLAVILGVDRHEGVSRVTSWTSMDGVTWTAHDASEAIETYQLERLRRIGDRFAVVGSGTGLWWSADGISWQADPIPWPAAIVWDIGTLGDRAVLVGQHGIIGEALVRDLPAR